MTDTSPADRPARRVLGVVGSLRADSFNAKLLASATSIAPDRLRIETAADLIRLPLFNEDLEVGGFPTRWSRCAN